MDFRNHQRGDKWTRERGPGEEWEKMTTKNGIRMRNVSTLKNAGRNSFNQNFISYIQSDLDA